MACTNQKIIGIEVSVPVVKFQRMNRRFELSRLPIPVQCLSRIFHYFFYFGRFFEYLKFGNRFVNAQRAKVDFR